MNEGRIRVRNEVMVFWVESNKGHHYPGIVNCKPYEFSMFQFVRVRSNVST